MMNYKIDVNFDRFEEKLQVVDAHTMGEFCRILVGGIPEPQGNTMIEKKKWLEENCDYIRTALMLEPRGHHDMFGAILCEPVHEEADFGVVFMETGEFLNMCGHCTIGTVTVVIEAGMIESHEGENEVVLDTPAGIVRTKAMVKNGKVESVTLTNVPSFVYLENQSVTIDEKEIHFTISFGGSFFALVDTAQLEIGQINAKTVPAYTNLGMKMLHAINEQIPVQHPELDITSVDLVEFYGPTPNPDKANMRNVVIFGDAQADRSPCGTGTSAKLATLHKWGEIGVGEPFVYESFMGSLFKGEIKELTTIGGYDAVVPMVTGSCYLTGVATYLIDGEDPLKYGFLIG
jgi:proline racemase